MNYPRTVVLETLRAVPESFAFQMKKDLPQMYARDSRAKIGRAPVSPSLPPVLTGQAANIWALKQCDAENPKAPKQVSTFLFSQRSWEENTKGSKSPASMVTVLNIPGPVWLLL